MASVVAEFICGCRHEVSVEDIGWWREISTDRDGFVICVRHRMRRKNWNSLPSFAGDKQRSDWSHAGIKPLDYERWLLFGQKLPEYNLDLDKNTPDLRDNRDPETVGMAFLARHNGHHD